MKILLCKRINDSDAVHIMGPLKLVVLEADVLLGLA